MRWIFLFSAILLEVAGTIFMKQSNGFSRPIPAIIALLLYLGSLSLMNLSFRYFEVSTVYATWSGLGISILALIGILFLGESNSILKTASLFLIITGVIGLNLSTNH